MFDNLQHGGFSLKDRSPGARCFKFVLGAAPFTSAYIQVKYHGRLFLHFQPM